MKSAAAIVVDGVLRKPVGGTPIPQGIALYRGLCAAFNVVLLRSDTDDDGFEDFVVTEMLTGHSNVIPWVTTGEPVGRVRQVGRLRGWGYAVDLVVEPDPRNCLYLYQAGFNVLHFLHAAYARPDWRPDFEGNRQPWEEMVAYAQQAAKLRAEDDRIGQFTDRMMDL